MEHSNESADQSQKEQMRLKYVQEWINILDEYAVNWYGNVQPHQRFSAYVSVFTHLPDVAKLYVCGLLNDAQLVELTKATERAYKEACRFAPQIEKPENIEYILPPTFEDVKDNLTDDLFHHPMMNDYLEIIDQMEWAAKIYDTQNLNMANEWICFEDMPQPVDVLVSDSLAEIDARMIDTLLKIRNGCMKITPDQKNFFDALVNRFCEDTLSNLLGVPENDLSVGATERGMLAHSFWEGIFNNSGLILTGSREDIMQQAVYLTRDMLASQWEDFDWTLVLLGWYDDVTLPYLNHLEDRRGIRKISTQIINKTMDNSRQNDGN